MDKFHAHKSQTTAKRTHTSSYTPAEFTLITNHDDETYQHEIIHVERRSPLGWLLLQEIIQVVLPALVLALVIHLFLAQATIVYGRSMEPNLFEAQRLIIDKISYRFRTPQRNDIVVINMPTMEEMLVKRVVGLPGETVEIHHGIVLIDDQVLDESFPHNLSEYDTPKITLGPLQYFVLGDNRGNSNDSRTFGSVQREYIIGRVWLRYWPLRQFKLF
ncbi:MAG: signal peptidase I [Caldilineaceae bacterium]